jgi:hypothetical protein
MSMSLLKLDQPVKYGNRKVVLDGESFDSKAEANRYQQLQVLQRAGQISDLTRQVSFVLAPKTVIQGKAKRSLIYRADFAYIENGQRIVEDVKGMLTAIYKVKRHLMKTVHGIEIRETK